MNDRLAKQTERAAWAFHRIQRLRKKGARGVTLVEVLIVVAIMAVIAGGATLLAFPMLKESKLKAARMGCMVVKDAAELYMNLEGSADVCPTMQDLISSRKLDAKKIDDPWGTPYRVACYEGEIHVVSAGPNKKDGDGDDIRDDFKDADIKKIMNAGNVTGR